MGITHATAAPGSDSGDGKISHNAWDEDHVGGIAEALIAALGDLIVGTGPDTAAILTAGADDYVLTAASGEATGLIWAAATGGGGGTPAESAAALIHAYTIFR
jgi:hypothetical protein